MPIEHARFQANISDKRFLRCTPPLIFPDSARFSFDGLFNADSCTAEITAQLRWNLSSSGIHEEIRAC